MKVMTYDEFAQKYCERQDNTPQQLLYTLRDQYSRWHCDGWMLLECEMLDSSRLAEFTIMPFGPDNTFKEPPDHPVSPRGLASDMSVVVGVTYAKDLPNKAATWYPPDEVRQRTRKKVR